MTALDAAGCRATTRTGTGERARYVRLRLLLLLRLRLLSSRRRLPRFSRRPRLLPRIRLRRSLSRFLRCDASSSLEPSTETSELEFRFCCFAMAFFSFLGTALGSATSGVAFTSVTSTSAFFFAAAHKPPAGTRKRSQAPAAACGSSLGTVSPSSRRTRSTGRRHPGAAGSGARGAAASCLSRRSRPRTRGGAADDEGGYVRASLMPSTNTFFPWLMAVLVTSGQ